VAYLDALSTVLPVLLLFGLGAFLGRRGFLRPGTTDDLRRLVLDVALPSALFLTFLRVQLQPELLLIVVSIFAACAAMLAAGPLIGRLVGIRSPLLPPLLTGFEAGMLGYAIFGAVFGTKELYRFAIVDIGQVVFVFFVLATALGRRSRSAAPTLGETARAFIRTPVILAIAVGIAAGAAGAGPVLDGAPLGRALLATLGLLAALTTPLITIVIGSTIRLSRRGLALPLRTVAVRMSLWVGLALVFTTVVIDGVLHLDRLFGAAVLTMAVLPPPFVIPLYLPADAATDEEREYVLSTLSLATLATLVAFSVVAVAYSA
jgi:malate permease and related proteins